MRAPWLLLMWPLVGLAIWNPNRLPPSMQERMAPLPPPAAIGADAAETISKRATPRFLTDDTRSTSGGPCYSGWFRGLCVCVWLTAMARVCCQRHRHPQCRFRRRRVLRRAASHRERQPRRLAVLLVLPVDKPQGGQGDFDMADGRCRCPLFPCLEKKEPS